MGQLLRDMEKQNRGDAMKIVLSNAELSAIVREWVQEHYGETPARNVDLVELMMDSTGSAVEAVVHIKELQPQLQAGPTG